MKRREFLNISALAGSGLVLGLNYACFNEEKSFQGKGETYEFAPFIEISDKGSIIVYAPIPEIGQGIKTSLAMILAEELDADWEQIVIKQAVANDKYGNMTAAGSTGVSRYYNRLRTAGATVKAMFKTAASQTWKVSESDLTTEDSFVINTANGKKLSYFELAEKASKLPVPVNVTLKEVSEFRIIGKAKKSVDLLNIITGKAVYGIDATIEGMKYVAIERCPVRGGKLISYDATRALSVDGVIKVVEVKPYRPIPYAEVLPGVAVIADSTSAALQGKKMLSVDWDYNDTQTEDNSQYRKVFQTLKDKKWEFELRRTDNFNSKLSESDTVLNFEYEIPFWAHYCMEPMNYTAHFSKEKCLLKGPSQRPQLVQDLIAQMYEIPKEQVMVESTMSGGAFGRRLAVDYAIEAIKVSEQTGFPVKVIWTREDDVMHDYFRTIAFHQMKVGLKNDNILSWFHHIMTKPVGNGPIYEVQGAADLPFKIPNVAIGYSRFPTNIQIGSWRSVAHTYNSFVVNNTITEVATDLNIDPLQFYLDLIAAERDEVTVELPLRGYRGKVTCDLNRMQKVLQKAAELSSWENQKSQDRALGIACAFYKTSYAAHVAEVVREDDEIKLKRITAVLDCGKVINPLGVKAQMEGSISDAITVTLKSSITIEHGLPQEINYDKHPVTRISDMPELTLHVMDSDEDPSGAGEPPFPSVAPAIANAIYRMTGERIRKLPISI